MKTIAPAELQNHLAADANVALLDVRTPTEFTAVHVPQARNVPLDTLDPHALLAAGAFKASQPVYFLCHSGGRATKAAERFAAAGFQDAVVVEGGTSGWEKAGLPVTRGKAFIGIERQVRIAAGSLVVLGVVLSYLVHPYFIGLSAFVGVGLVFAGITDWCGMGLLLARAPWNQRRA